MSLCSSGMPLACGPWWRTTATKSRRARPLEQVGERLLAPRPPRPAPDQAVLGATAEVLTTAPEVAAQALEAAVGANGRPPGAARRRRPMRPARRARRAPVEPRLDREALQAMAQDAPLHVGVQQAGLQQLRDQEGMPPAAWKWFTSALPFG